MIYLLGFIFEIIWKQKASELLRPCHSRNTVDNGTVPSIDTNCIFRNTTQNQKMFVYDPDMNGIDQFEFILGNRVECMPPAISILEIQHRSIMWCRAVLSGCDAVAAVLHVCHYSESGPHGDGFDLIVRAVPAKSVSKNQFFSAKNKRFRSSYNKDSIQYFLKGGVLEQRFFL